MKRIFIGLMAVAMILTAIPLSTLANLEENSLDPEIKEEIRVNFTEAGIDEETQAQLFAKLERGELLDANNLEMEGTGVTVETEYVDDNGELVNEIRTTYPDGSVDLSTISGGVYEEVEEDNNLITPFAITGGSYQAGTGYATWTGRTVKRNQGAVSSSFKADYTFVTRGYAQISRVYEWSISGVGDLGNITLTVSRARETAFDPAYAFLRFTGTVGGNYTTTFYHRLYVQGTRAWDTN